MCGIVDTGNISLGSSLFKIFQERVRNIRNRAEFSKMGTSLVWEGFTISQ